MLNIGDSQARELHINIGNTMLSDKHLHFKGYLQDFNYLLGTSLSIRSAQDITVRIFQSACLAF